MRRHSVALSLVDAWRCRIAGRDHASDTDPGHERPAGVACLLVLIALAVPRSVAGGEISAVSPDDQSILGFAEPSISLDGRIVGYIDETIGYPPGAGGRQRYGKLISTDLSTGMSQVPDDPYPFDGFYGATSIRISGNGRFIAFASDRPALVPEDANGVADVFRYDLVTHEYRRVSVAADGSELPYATGVIAISDDGDRVLFGPFTQLFAGRSTDSLFVRELSSSRTIPLRSTPSIAATMSGNGRYLVFSEAPDADTVAVARQDIDSGDLVPVARLSENVSLPNVVTSVDGRVVAYTTRPQPQLGVHIATLADGSVASDRALAFQVVSADIALSGDGRWLAGVVSDAQSVAGDANRHNDIIRIDLSTDQVALLSRNSDGTPTDDNSSAPSLNRDGSVCVFLCRAYGVVPDHFNFEHAFQVIAYSDEPLRTPAPGTTAGGTAGTGTGGTAGSTPAGGGPGSSGGGSGGCGHGAGLLAAAGLAVGAALSGMKRTARA